MNNQKNCSGAFVRTGSRISMSKSVIFLALTAVVLLNACGPSMAEKAFKEKQAAIADSVSNYVPGIAADTVDGVTRYFIRKADMKLKVPNVLEASEKIEDFVSLRGGYIANSELVSEPISTDIIHHTKDSLVEVKRFAVTGSVSLRIPSRYLDSVVRYASRMALFVDYKTVRSDDIKLALFANQQAEQRIQVYQKRLKAVATATAGKHANAIAREDKLLEKQTAADEARLDSYSLADQVNYSTVTLQMYQAPQTLLHKMPSDPIVPTYDAPFSEKFSAEFLSGFEFIKSFILLVTGSWGGLVVLLAIVMALKVLVTRLNAKSGTLWK